MKTNQDNDPIAERCLICFSSPEELGEEKRIILHCGHIYCASCLETLVEEKVSKVCAFCFKDIPPEVVPFSFKKYFYRDLNKTKNDALFASGTVALKIGVAFLCNQEGNHSYASVSQIIAGGLIAAKVVYNSENEENSQAISTSAFTGFSTALVAALVDKMGIKELAGLSVVSSFVGMGIAVYNKAYRLSELSAYALAITFVHHVFFAIDRIPVSGEIISSGVSIGALSGALTSAIMNIAKKHTGRPLESVSLIVSVIAAAVIVYAGRMSGHKNSIIQIGSGVLGGIIARRLNHV